MIKTILNMLSVDDFYGKSENIDIAKGINKIPTTFSELKKQVKRRKAWQKRK